MALLQNDKAVFYHPLDDSTESLQSQAWTGTGTFGAAKISSGLVADAGTVPTFGAESEFLAGAVGTGDSYSGISITKLDATKFVVGYDDGADSRHGTAKVGTVSGTDITFGAETEFLSVTSADEVVVAALSATKFVVTWQNGSVDAFGRAKVGTVSGTDITFGAEATFLGVFGTNYGTVAVLSATSFVVVYHQTSTVVGASKVGTVSGTDVTFGAEHQFIGTDVAWVYAAALSATKIVVAYQDTAVTGEGRAKIGTVSGTDITYGSAHEYKGSTVIHNYLAKLDATTFVVAYRNNGGTNQGLANIGTVSGTDITYGAEAEWSSNGVNVSVAAFSATKFVVSYRDAADANHGTSKVGTVSGTSITFAAEAEFVSTGQGSLSSTATFGESKFVVAYQDATDSNHGTAKVGSLAGTAARTAPTPGAYDSAAAATKVGFVGWLKNPSA